MQPDDRQRAEATPGGVTPLARQLMQLMNAKLESLQTYDEFENEALASNNLHALALIHECRLSDLATISQLRAILGRDFVTDRQDNIEQTAEIVSAGGGLETREVGALNDPIDQAADDTFPASDPPSSTGTTIP